MKGVSDGELEENRHLLLRASTNSSVVEAPVEINRVNVALLFVAAILYNFAVGGAIEVLGAFVLRAPLSWNATLVSFLPHFCDLMQKRWDKSNTASFNSILSRRDNSKY